MTPFQKGSEERRLTVKELAKRLAVAAESTRSDAIGSSVILPEIRKEFDRELPGMLHEAADELVKNIENSPGAKLAVGLCWEG